MTLYFETAFCQFCSGDLRGWRDSILHSIIRWSSWLTLDATNHMRDFETVIPSDLSDTLDPSFPFLGDLLGILRDNCFIS